MDKITWTEKTKDWCNVLDKLNMKVSVAQINFLAKCINIAAHEGFYDIGIDAVSSALYEFGLTKEDIEQLCSGYSLDDSMVESKLTKFFIA